MRKNKANKEIKIYSKGHRKASDETSFWSRTKVLLVNVLIFIGCLLWLLINLMRDAASIKGGGIIALLFFGGVMIWRLIKFYQDRKEHVITFDGEGILIDDPKNASYYEWDDISYFVWDKRTNKYLLLNENQEQVGEIDHSVYDFSKEELEEALALSPHKIKEIPYKEYLSWWGRNGAYVFTIAVLIIVFGFIILFA